MGESECKNCMFQWDINVKTKGKFEPTITDDLFAVIINVRAVKYL